MEAGREVGADDGFEDGADVGATHGTVDTLPVPCRVADPGGGGRPGNGLLDDANPEAVPQDRVCETVERDDWAVEDLSLSTRFVLGLEAPDDDDVDVAEVIEAQPKGIDPPLVLLGPGREG